MKKLFISLMLVSVALTIGSCTSCSNSGNKTSEVKEIKKMKTITLNKEQFNTKVVDITNTDQWRYLGDKPALIDFYADWCGPCKMIAPVLEELAAEYDGQIIIYKVNVDKEQELAAAFGVRSIPTLLFIPIEGQPQLIQGAKSKGELEKIINSVLLGK